MVVGEEGKKGEGRIFEFFCPVIVEWDRPQIEGMIEFDRLWRGLSGLPDL